MGIQIGPFAVRVRNLNSTLDDGLRKAYRFQFPHDRFAGVDLKERLAAVASDHLYYPSKRVMLLSGRIEGEGPRLDFAVLTGNPEGIASSKLAFLVLANYDGQTNVVVKVEEIKELGAVRAAARKPRTAKAPATVPPEPELRLRHLDLGTNPERRAVDLVHRLVMQHGKEYLRAKPFEEARPDLVDKFVKGQLPEIALIDAVYYHYGWPRTK